MFTFYITHLHIHTHTHTILHIHTQILDTAAYITKYEMFWFFQLKKHVFKAKPT